MNLSATAIAHLDGKHRGSRQLHRPRFLHNRLIETFAIVPFVGGYVDREKLGLGRNHDQATGMVRFLARRSGRRWLVRLAAP